MSCRFCVSSPTTAAPADSTKPRISSQGSASFGHGRSGSDTLTSTAFSLATERLSRWVSNALLMIFLRHEGMPVHCTVEIRLGEPRPQGRWVGCSHPPSLRAGVDKNNTTRTGLDI